ncbi:MAG TPA: hypothetical protein V6C52_09445 [Coleofasciculaceae cyanobacterium]|jgi:hypothetical protein
MFSKKKKQDAPANLALSQSSFPESAPAVSRGQSLFAPGINPAPASINFFTLATPAAQPEIYPAFQEALPQPQHEPSMPQPLVDTRFDEEHTPQYGSNPTTPEVHQDFGMPAAPPEWQSAPLSPAEPLTWQPETSEIPAGPVAEPEAFHAWQPTPGPTEEAAWQPEPEWQTDHASMSDPMPASMLEPQWQPEPEQSWQTETPIVEEPAWLPSAETPEASAPWQPSISDDAPLGTDHFTETWNTPNAPEDEWQTPELNQAPEFAQPDMLEAAASISSEAWTPPADMNLPPQTSEIYPQEYTNPTPAGALSAEDLWHQMQPNQQDVAAPIDPMSMEFTNSGDTPTLHVESQSSPTELTNQTLWDNLASSTAPGQQVPTDPLSSGHFLDAVNGQLYPDDPLHLDPVSLNAGEQAFEEAAQFLFPETLNAPLEWGDNTTREPYVSDPLLEIPSPQTPFSMDLGPSHQLEPGSFNDLSSVYLEPPEPVTFEIAQPAPIPQSAPESTILPDSLTPPDLAAEPELAPPAFQPVISDPDLTPDELWFPEGMEADEEASDSEPALTNSGQPFATYDSILGTLPTDDAVALQPAGPEEEDMDSLAAYFEEQDFYAPSFTLNEQGEIIPDHGQYVLPETSSTEASPETSFDSLWSQGAMLSAPNGAESQSSPEPVSSWNLEETAREATRFSPADEEEDIPVYSLDEPATPSLQAMPAEMPMPSDNIILMPSLEDAWHTPPSAEAETEPATQANTGEFSMENLEIIGVCPLEDNKRLLLVQSNNTFALMGQVGLENPQVSVLKLFEQNPIAYQTTFTAAQEGQAGSQGMYVVQVGTWHAVLSTFQQNILLHTELG